MNEPEAEDNPAEGWSPPTGAPAPRPDPYAQFGNPLHDTWGTSEARPSVVPQEARARKVHRLRPALRRVITAGIVALLAVGGWYARDTIIDAWDRVYDKASDLSGGDGDTGDVAGGSESTTTTTESTDERMAEMEAISDEAFDDWMGTNSGVLSAAVHRIDAVSAEMEVLNQQLGSNGIIDLNAYRGAMVESRDATVAAAQILDAAPDSAIRHDFVTVLLLQANATGLMIAASDAQEEAGLRAASERLQRVSAETRRLCRQHGARAKALCE